MVSLLVVSEQFGLIDNDFITLRFTHSFIEPNAEGRKIETNLTIKQSYMYKRIYIKLHTDSPCIEGSI